MAEEAKNEETGDGASAEGKKSSSKLLIIIIIAVLILGGAGAGAYFMLSSSDEEVAAEEEEEKAPVEITSNFYDMPEMLINLTSSGSATRYLKISVTLEVGSPEDLASIEKLMPRIVDDFQLYLRALRIEDLKGSAGLYRLKEALLLRANQAASPVKVNAILIKDFLIQ